ncbi:MAG: PilZ domain-containing protein [Sphingomonas sp.]|nr:PilZ domain-containing protein [Sphingomonas sp.]MBW0007404.1 PilZ domain-containing protein [Sphingomonas sp.]
MAKKLVETTNYSLSANAPVRPDRRSGERYVSLLRVGAMTVEGRRELCLIRNISAGGMMIRPYSPIAVGAHLTVELKQGNSVSGIAQWADNGMIGVVFDEPIDVVALLTATDGKPQPRMPRIELDCSALIRHDGNVSRVDVVNISQGGICIRARDWFEINSNVVVTLNGLHAAAGVVKWMEDDYYGIGFNRVYPVSELMTFLQEQQREEHRRARAA